MDATRSERVAYALTMTACDTLHRVSDSSPLHPSERVSLGRRRARPVAAGAGFPLA